MQVIMKLPAEVFKDGRLYIPKRCLEEIGVKEGETCFIEVIKSGEKKFIVISRNGFQ